MNRTTTRRNLLGLLGTGTAAGLAGCSGVRIGSSREERPTTAANSTETTSLERTATETPEPIEIAEPPAELMDVPLPSEPASSDYAVMGSDGAPVTATVYGSWKCPYTRKFVRDRLGTIVRRYVQPGRLKLAFRAVPYENGEPFHGSDEPFVARTGLAVWHTDPRSYWRYFAYAFENIEGVAGWATARRMRRLLAAAGVDAEREILTAAEGETYEPIVERTMERVRAIPITKYPRVAIGETVTAPTVDFSATLNQIERAVERSGRR